MRRVDTNLAIFVAMVVLEFPIVYSTDVRSDPIISGSIRIPIAFYVRLASSVMLIMLLAKTTSLCDTFSVPDFGQSCRCVSATGSMKWCCIFKTPELVLRRSRSGWSGPGAGHQFCERCPGLRRKEATNAQWHYQTKNGFAWLVQDYNRGEMTWQADPMLESMFCTDFVFLMFPLRKRYHNVPGPGRN